MVVGCMTQGYVDEGKFWRFATRKVPSVENLRFASEQLEWVLCVRCCQGQRAQLIRLMVMKKSKVEVVIGTYCCTVEGDDLGFVLYRILGLNSIFWFWCFRRWRVVDYWRVSSLFGGNYAVRYYEFNGVGGYFCEWLLEFGSTQLGNYR